MICVVMRLAVLALMWIAQRCGYLPQRDPDCSDQKVEQPAADTACETTILCKARQWRSSFSILPGDTPTLRQQGPMFKPPIWINQVSTLK